MNKVELLITNGIVMTMDPDLAVIQNGAVAVTGDQITAVDEVTSFSGWAVDKTIDAGGGIIMPGLINTHTHAAMTCFRGLADDLPLAEWLNNYIFPAEAKLNRDMVFKGTMLACAEMIMSGTTTFCDMYLFEGAVAEAAKQAEIRAVVGEVLYDFPSPHYGPLEKGFEYTENLIKKWQNDPIITIAVEPHSTYLCAPELLKKAADISEKYNVPLVIHVSETEFEVSQIKERFGLTPVSHLAELGVLSPRLLACHCVVLNDADISLLKQSDTRVSHNPESNMKLASGISPVPDLIDAGICVGVGTDGCASNNALDLFLEMDTAAKLHKVNRLDPTVMDAMTVLKMSTIDGARSLGLDKITGSIEPGKKADIIVIDTHKPHLTPMYHPESHLVYAVRGSDVDTSIINGKVVMENRALKTIDIETVIADIRDIAKNVVKS
ncbi:MAG: amidohydrolase [Desulfobacterales bacterium]|nr:amidohydrolase [Desulfobacterales bacterium]